MTTKSKASELELALEAARATHRYGPMTWLATVIAAAERTAALENEKAELMDALKVAHNAMQTWFSSEYIEHPTTRIVGEALERIK